MQVFRLLNSPRILRPHFPASYLFPKPQLLLFNITYQHCSTERERQIALEVSSSNLTPDKVSAVFKVSFFYLKTFHKCKVIHILTCNATYTKNKSIFFCPESYLKAHSITRHKNTVFFVNVGRCLLLILLLFDGQWGNWI